MNRHPKLTNQEVAAIDNNTCPDCGGTGFMEGPHGGMNVNIMCANDRCQSKFNVIPGMDGSFGKERISGQSPARTAILDAVFKPLD
jgi:hypothetical protein